MCYLRSDRKRWQQTLIRITFSVVLWRGRNTANKYLRGLWGVLVVNGKHRVCQSFQGDVHFSDPTTHASDAPWGHSHRWAMCLMHFPGPSYSGSQVFYEGPVPGEPCMSHSSQAQPVQTPQFSARAQSQVCSLSPAIPWPKLLRFLSVLWKPSPSWAIHLLLFLGPSGLVFC